MAKKRREKSLIGKILQHLGRRVKAKFGIRVYPIIAAASLAATFVLISLVTIFKDLPAPAELTTRSIPQTTKILDRNGKLLYNIYVSENRTIVPLSDIPLELQQATIAIEDKDFYQHGGINVLGGMVRAIKDMVVYRKLEGGSTITQQLIKTSLLTPERTIQRKIKEVILAFWTERLYAKDKILWLYLNKIPYGGTSYGVEEAAQIYFGKRAKDLTLSESALLAGLPAAPTFYSPFGTDPERAVSRQHQVLDRMVEDGYIAKDTAEKAKAAPLKFASESAGIKAPHFVAYVKELLVKKYGEQLVEQGGLKVTTSLDLDLQESAQATLSSEVTRQKNLRVGNGAALITKPATGEILVMAGSRDYFATDGGKVNIALALRSPGSSIKPLNYALGFLNGTSTPATPWIDAPFCFPPFNGKTYCPQNYDNQFHGTVQTRYALGNSYNVPAVKQLAANKVEDFIATASAMGITTFTDKDRYGYSLTLGGGEIKMVDMATAFGVLANEGRRADLHPILRVEDAAGEVLENADLPEYATPDPWDGGRSWQPYQNFVLPTEVTFLISHILMDDGARSGTFGEGSILNLGGRPVSVKTGTTEDKRDNWSIGYTTGPDNRLVAVWVGNNDNSPMSPYLESGNTGAAPIWNKLMLQSLKEAKTIWPQKPENVAFLEICNLSGLLPANDCPKRGEYFIKYRAPRDQDNIWGQKRKILVYKDTKKVPKPGENPSPDQLEEEEHQIISDPFQKDFCADCAF